MSEATIYAEEACVLSHEALPENQFLLRLQAPLCAKSVKAGNFIHLSCSRDPFSLKRPFSVMRTSRENGWIEILYKVVGSGTQKLATAKPDDRLHCLGPIGNSFELDSNNARPLLLGGGVGIPPIFFFAEHLKKHQDVTPLVIMGSEIPFPFKTKPSTIMVEGIPNDVIASMALLEDLSIPSRLASNQGYAGCFHGYIHELAELWIQTLNQADRATVEVFACGPAPMLEATSRVSQAYGLKCKLSLEEHMACAVGGCAGCTVRINENGKEYMKRVCVDGPVFNADAVYPPL